jgi:hypothetical protein
VFEDASVFNAPVAAASLGQVSVIHAMHACVHCTVCMRLHCQFVIVVAAIVLAHMINKVQLAMMHKRLPAVK